MRSFAVMLASVASLAFCAAARPASAEEVTVAKDETVQRDVTTGKKSEPVHVGAYAAAGFPSPLTLGAMISFEKTVSLGFEYGFLPASKLGSVDVTYRSFAGDLRFYPLQSPFFFGVRVGKQHIAGATTISAPPYGSATVTTDADTWYVNPRVGFLWATSIGLTIGMDAGLRIPTSHTSSNNLPSGIAMPSAVTNVTDVLARKTIPTVTLLQLGMQF